MARDLDIGTPPVDTLNINILHGDILVNALGETNTEIQDVGAEIRKVRRVNELILGQKVDFGSEEV